ncbi:GHKL domain-containing protein [bacterium]|nr:GHKL domain-containing protein [bacterium]
MPSGAKVWGLLLVCAAALVYSFTNLAPGAPPPMALAFVAGAVWFESRSVRLPGAGMASCSFVFLLAMALLPGVGPAWPALLACMLVLVRTGLWGYPEMRLRWLEGTLDLAPMLVSLASLGVVARFEPKANLLIVQGGVATLVYCLLMLEARTLLALQLPAGLRERNQSVQLDVLSLRFAGCCASLLLAWLGNPGQLWSFLAWPLLGLLPKVVEQTVRGEEKDQQRNVLRQLDASKHQLEDASRAQKMLTEDLHRKVDENRILEAASQTLLQVRNCQQTADEIVKLCGSLVQASSTAVFLGYEGQLYPRSCQSIHAERLQSCALLGLNEAVLGEAWRTRTVQRVPLGTPDQRIFSSEGEVLVFPLGTAGVLYVGRPSPPFSPIEVRHLSQAAGQGALALQIATHLEALEAALFQQAAVSSELQEWAGILDRLLSSSVEFLDKMDRPAFLEKLTQSAGSLFPHDSLEVSLDGLAGELAAQVMNSRLPLLIEDISKTRFQPHRAGQRSLLCVPICHPDLHKVGLILMGADKPGAFTRWQRDSLSLLGTLAAVAWKNLELYAETLAAQGQLVQSSKMAAVGQLAAGVAHEMNTPLGSVMLNVESAQKMVRSNPDQAEKRLQKAKEMVQRTRAIVEKLLYYSRQSEHGRVSTDLGALVQDTLQLVGHSLTIDQVRIVLNLGSVGPVLVNQNEIQQVLCNLLLNARDAMVTGEGSTRDITVSTFEKEGWACLSVRDTGPGMSDELLARVMEPFFTTKAVGQGTGLGLSISQQIVAAHEGQLRVASAPGQGSEFTVALPLA